MRFSMKKSDFFQRICMGFHLGYNAGVWNDYAGLLLRELDSKPSKPPIEEDEKPREDNESE